ncbi:hypothetical protein D3C87_1715070 [compost metagenome]
MTRLRAALAKEEKTRNHEKQRNADAGRRVQNIRDVPVYRADTVGISDIPGGGVNHHDHQTGYSSQIINPVNF